MKRTLFFLFAIGVAAMSSVSMAAMSNSRIRQETRFLTDKMAYELRLSTNQYNDAYEINYDFIYAVSGLLDRVARGDDWATDRYYTFLDVRNDDLRWVLTASQYRSLIRADYFFRPIYASEGRWNFRVYINYTNHNHYYYAKPYHYTSYCGGHYRTNYRDGYYRNRYTHERYTEPYSVRNEKVYQSNRRSDFGRPGTRPGTRPESSSVRNTRPATNNSSSSSVRNTRPATNNSSAASSSKVEKSDNSNKSNETGRRSSSRSRDEAAGRRNR